MAQNNLGTKYENGQGVSKVLLRAIEDYRLAAKQGYEKAIERLSQLGVSID
jgi:TPR repeat protein